MYIGITKIKIQWEQDMKYKCIAFCPERELTLSRNHSRLEDFSNQAPDGFAQIS